MPRVHHRKAAKDYPAQGIKRGDMYYTWKFRYGGVRRSLKRPRPSQLTQSEYLSQAYAFEEQVEDMAVDDAENVASELEDMAGEIETLGDEQRERRENMPEGLQEGEIGELLEGRADCCEQVRDSIEEAASDIREMASEADDDDEADEEPLEDRIRARLDEIDWTWEQ